MKKKEAKKNIKKDSDYLAFVNHDTQKEINLQIEKYLEDQENDIDNTIQKLKTKAKEHFKSHNDFKFFILYNIEINKDIFD